jgi:hypothetical protein
MRQYARCPLDPCLPSYHVHCGKNFQIFREAADQTLPVTEFSEIYNRKIKLSYLSRNIQLQITFGLLHLGKSGSFRHSDTVATTSCLFITLLLADLPPRASQGLTKIINFCAVKPLPGSWLAFHYMFEQAVYFVSSVFIPLLLSAVISASNSCSKKSV